MLIIIIPPVNTAAKLGSNMKTCANPVDYKLSLGHWKIAEFQGNHWPQAM
jgi:hypothetical protein